MKTLIRSGQIVSDGRSFQGDILIENEKIVAVDKKIAKADGMDRVIDAAGFEVFPGGVDPHVHLEMETPQGISSDDFASGSRAALAGGTTTILDFVTPGRGESLLAALAARKAAARKSLCDYGLHVSVTAIDGGLGAELDSCRRHEGIASLKTYLAYKETIGLDDDEFLAVLDLARRLNLLVMVHAESGGMVSYLQKKLLAQGKISARYHAHSRPPEVEGDAVGRALLMARLAGVPLYIVHVSSRQGVEAVAAARQARQTVIGETCPQYLLLDENRYLGGDEAAAVHVMSPPLRSGEHQAALWEALGQGIIQTLATDHCPFTLAEKKKFAAVDFTRIPSGCGGIEYRLSLLYSFGVKSGKISLAKFVDLVSTRPAKIFGLYPRKGTIRTGSDADLVIWDPQNKKVISAARQWQSGDHTVYEGLQLVGSPHLVFSRGAPVFENETIQAEAGRGNYLARDWGRDNDGHRG
ncbi:MAG TPA: dihydropyrimidinase [Patescibacteria group bacterium]|nr:dihydropyrimidinase [Patescibacteria group bacterium]